MWSDVVRLGESQFHAPESKDRNQAERAIEFQRLLRRLLDVCNAIHYAHRRGVLHRDLKPGNIMLGEFGETLVVDWGLAKPLGTVADHLDSKSQTARGQAPLVPHSGSHIDPTQLGSAVGTPAFMSPEQAHGRLDQLGPAADVFSLGATLYALLTGKAPIHKDEESGRVSAAEALERIRSGNWPRPRAVNSEVPKPLEAICLKAMALEPRDRYLSARELANDIERYLADEHVTVMQVVANLAICLAQMQHRQEALLLQEDIMQRQRNWTAPLWRPIATRSVSEGTRYGNFLAYASGYDTKAF